MKTKLLCEEKKKSIFIDLLVICLQKLFIVLWNHTCVWNFYAPTASANHRVPHSQEFSLQLSPVCFFFSQHNIWMYYILLLSEYKHEAWHLPLSFLIDKPFSFLTLLLFVTLTLIKQFFHYLPLLSPCLSIL